MFVPFHRIIFVRINKLCNDSNQRTLMVWLNYIRTNSEVIGGSPVTISKRRQFTLRGSKSGASRNWPLRETE